MDNIRIALLMMAAVVCFFLYQAWINDYPPSQKSADEQHAVAASSQNNRSPAAGDVPNAGDVPSGPTASTGKTQSPAAEGKIVHVVTDKLDVQIDTLGGGLAKVALRGVPLSDKQPHTNLRLINDTLPDFFIEQNGLIAKNGDAPNHTTQFSAARYNYRMAKGQKVLSVPLTWKDASGHEVTKVYTFHRGSYRIGLNQKVQNGGRSAWGLSQYVRYWRAPHSNTGDVPFSHAFFGAGWYEAKSDNKYAYETRKRSDILKNPLNLTQTGGWVALVQHYFIGAVIPPKNAKVHLFARAKKIEGKSGGYAAGFIGPQRQIAPGASGDFKSTLFIGPKYQDQLSTVAPGLGLTVDYGWFSLLARPIFRVLNFLHSWVGNWGLAIILLTCLIKLLFYKLSEIQFRGMARMRKFQPRIAKLKEQYGDDKAELQKRMMELYRKEGVNPVAGCWPLLLQMPVFISLYWVLRESVELRHAPFVLWIHDLSAPDPYYILPVIFGVSMFVQQRLNANAAMDPMQQRIMQIMPVGMAFFFAFFPAGLVLYWCTNNLLTIAQQWYIYRKLDKEGLGRNASAG